MQSTLYSSALRFLARARGLTWAALDPMSASLSKRRTKILSALTSRGGQGQYKLRKATLNYLQGAGIIISRVKAAASTSPGLSF